MFKILNLKNNNYLKYLFIVILFLISFLTSFIILFFKLKAKNVNTAHHNLAITENYKYFVKDINGKINIFSNKSNKPTIILEQPTIFLPEYDQKMLRDGIFINSIDELTNLIEDYS